MTKKQYEQLSRWEQTYCEATHDYYRAITRSDLVDMNMITEPIGLTITQSEMSCSRCVLAYLKKVAELYYGYQEAAQIKAAKAKAKQTKKENEQQA